MLFRSNPGSGLQHFPYVCFSDDATGLRHPIDASRLATLEGNLQERLAQLIHQLCAQGTLPLTPLYGMRVLCRWHSLVITVASKLCLGQLRRNTAVAELAPGGSAASAVGATIFSRLPHFRLAPQGEGDSADPIRWLGASLRWECCGFWDRDPIQGRVTVPDPHAHLHLHGCSTDLRFGGHLHHEHVDSRLEAIERLVLYPLGELHWMAADPAVLEVGYDDGVLRFCVANLGLLDASDLGIVVVINDRWSTHQRVRLPWLAAGQREHFTMPLPLVSGQHRIEVIIDPDATILEAPEARRNNSRWLEVVVKEPSL